MDEKRRTNVSKFLSYVLRHEPGAVGLTLDAAGWVEVESLLEACGRHENPLGRAELDEVVATSPKQRFGFSEDGARIRANQGHSTSVDLGYAPVEPPDLLFHGTVASVLPTIRLEGLRRMERHHVHLSQDEATARVVGGRRGKAVLLRIDGRAMHAAGHVFFRTPNGVWLTDAVPPEFVSSVDED